MSGSLKRMILVEREHENALLAAVGALFAAGTGCGNVYLWVIESLRRQHIPFSDVRLDPAKVPQDKAAYFL